MNKGSRSKQQIIMQTPNAGLLTNVRNSDPNNDYALNDTSVANDTTEASDIRREN